MKPTALILLPSAGLVAGWFLRPVLQTGSGPGGGAAPVEIADAEPEAGNQPGAPGKTAAAAPAMVKSDALPPLVLTDPRASIKSLLSFSRRSNNPLRTQARLLAFADSLTPAELKAFALEASHQPTNYWGGDSAVKDILLGHWAEIAPKEALAFVTGSNTAATRAALDTVFSQLAVTDPRAAEAALASLGEGRKKGALRAMAARIARDRPLEAIALLDRQKSPAGDYAYSSVMNIWSNHEPAAAASYASSLPDGPKRRQALYNVSRGMAQSDPEGALAWAKSLPRSSESLDVVRSVIGDVAGRDPQTALAMAKAQPLREQRNLMINIAQSWMSTDPEGAVGWIKTMDDGATRQQCIANIAYYAAYAGPGANLDALVSLLPPGQARNNTLETVSSYLGWSAPDTSLAWARTLPQEDQDRVLGRISSSLAATDPKKAADLAASLPPSASAMEAVTAVANQWAYKSPEEAIAWAGTLESEKARQDATSAALAQWADRDPEKAAAATGQLADENARRSAREKIAASWAQKSPAEAEKWALSLPPADRYSALASVWNATAGDDPAKTAASLAATLPAAAGIDSASPGLAASAGRIATAWVSQDPQAAAAWATQLPDGKAREAAMASIADQWATTDTMAASTWINQLPPGRSRDEAAAKLIEKITPTDPTAAFTWAANIQDPDKQLQSLKNTINAWKVYNPEAVRAAVSQSNLDEATVTKLEAELK